MRRIVARGATDVGRVRQGNEDALLVSSSVFAVADGMGGHLAGEVASATALEPIRTLDGKVFAEPAEAVAALRDAVVAANARVAQLADSNPSYRGMGTTLTAALVEGKRLHVAHVGDSRAYLLREGQFSQLTDDHTLVQHLIDEGQITREEAASHPQRSVITRAIGVAPEVDVDSMSLDLQAGDQFLLCSDGLTGVVADAAIAEVLRDEEDADTAVRALIERANDAGGPDNITVLLLRYDDPDGYDDAGPRTIQIRSRQDGVDGDWAGRLGTYGAGRADAPSTSSGDDDLAVGRILGRAVAIVVGLGVLAGLVWGGGTFLLSRSYYVGLDGQQVVVYQGINRTVGPIELSRVVERTELTLDDIPAYHQPVLEAGRPVADLNDARWVIRNIPTRGQELVDTDTGTATEPTPEPAA